MISVPSLIRRKRDGLELRADEIRELIKRYTAGKVPDYQMSAFAMAVFFSGMTPQETTALTLAMRDSGKVLTLNSVKGKKVDKHSTGGVGDKISICLAPMVAACGVPVPMISGRGLGHTGGTLDKLEAIPGFNVTQTTKVFEKQVAKIGCSLIGQTADLAPADKKLYALRDVTATVESIPLITASILSKKLAEGIDALVLDVKVGRGAFMKDLKSARALARSIVDVGKLAKKKVTAVLTRMDNPLGLAIGNALETKEAIEILHGRGPADVTEITLALGAEMLCMGGKARHREAALAKLEKSIRSGAALVKMKEIVAAQHGDIRVVDEPDRLRASKNATDIVAKNSGYVASIDAFALGMSAVRLGAGREYATDKVDAGAGLLLSKQVGDTVKKGERIATLYSKSASKFPEAINLATKAFEIQNKKPRKRSHVIERLS